MEERKVTESSYEYKIPLSHGEFVLRLPVPIARLGKRDRKKLFKLIDEIIDDRVMATRMYAQGLIDNIRKKYGLEKEKA